MKCTPRRHQYCASLSKGMRPLMKREQPFCGQSKVDEGHEGPTRPNCIKNYNFFKILILYNGKEKLLNFCNPKLEEKALLIAGIFLAKKMNK